MSVFAVAAASRRNSYSLAGAGPIDISRANPDHSGVGHYEQIAPNQMGGSLESNKCARIAETV
jgi:hypothetical protein